MTYKHGPLSDIEQYYVQQNPSNMTVEQLANKVCRTVKQVEKAIAQVGKVKHLSTTSTRKSTTGEIDKLMGKHLRNEKIVATVMTSAASETADATRKQKLNLSKKMLSSIHKPMG